jgi:hypothetical protein
MDDSTLEIAISFNLRHIRSAEMSTSNYHVVELLDEISVVFQLSGSNSEFLGAIIEGHALDTGISLDPLLTLVLLEAGHDVLVQRLSWRIRTSSLSEVILEGVVSKLEAFFGSVGEKLSVHATMDWLTVPIKSGSPGVIPETSGTRLLLVADNLGNLLSVGLSFCKGDHL